LLGLVNDILDYTKMTSGNVQLQLQNVCVYQVSAIAILAAFVSHTVVRPDCRRSTRLDGSARVCQESGCDRFSESHRLLLSDHNRCAPDPTGWAHYTGSHCWSHTHALCRCAQIIANLVSNAIKFTRTGQIVITVDVVEFKSSPDNGSVFGVPHGGTSTALGAGGGWTGDGEGIIHNDIAHSGPAASGVRIRPTVARTLSVPPSSATEQFRRNSLANPDKTFVMFRVTDSGQGLAMNEAPRLFQRFSQLEDTSATRQGGTGLGLAISAGLVAIMGGRIGCFSEGPGLGTEFFFCMPVHIRGTTVTENYMRHMKEGFLFGTTGPLGRPPSAPPCM
jgi:signal transduction histidine kinase